MTFCVLQEALLGMLRREFIAVFRTEVPSLHRHGFLPFFPTDDASIAMAAVPWRNEEAPVRRKRSLLRRSFALRMGSVRSIPREYGWFEHRRLFQLEVLGKFEQFISAHSLPIDRPAVIVFRR